MDQFFMYHVPDMDIIGKFKFRIFFKQTAYIKVPLNVNPKDQFKFTFLGI